MKRWPAPLFGLLLATPLAGQVGQTLTPLYRAPTAPIDARVQDLLGRMTLEEKFWQLFMVPGDLDDPTHDYSHGIYGLQISPAPNATSARAQAERINSIQRYFVERTRLGIPIIPFDEALHGLARPDATAFPQSIALAATFDTAMMGEVARAIAEETGRRGVRQVLSPMINIASDVRWGRTEESYGEDPWLTSQMTVPFVRAFEAAGIVTTPKHLVANVGEGGRDSYPIDATSRELDERFFPPFVAAVAGGARAMMSAYNSVNGLPATQNPWLLTTVLRDRWGFRGVVISDAAATGGATVLQMTEPDTPTAAKHAWEAGLDVVFQSSWSQYRSYWDAVDRGLVSPALIDSAVAQVLRLKFSLGLFERPYVDPDAAAASAGSPEHLALARRAAREAMVLLKNDHATLPLSRTTSSVAVIGVDATEARLGGYSGPGTRTVSILAGLRAALPHSTVRATPGPGRPSPEYLGIPTAALHSARGPGLQGEYFQNLTLAGTPQIVRRDPQVDFAWTLGTPGEQIAGDWYSARWTGTLTAAAGLTRLGVEGDDGYRLWLDGRLLIDRWTPASHRATLIPVRLSVGSRHALKLEFHSSVPNGRIKLIWDAGADHLWRRRIDEAVALARRSSVAIVLAGIEEGEFRDRAYLGLPGHQEELIRAVAATGRPTVVVLVGGSAITMSSWLDQADAVLLAWYPGQEGGSAVADILLGDDSPAGRLPITFPISEGQLPLHYDHRPTGRGDDYLDSTGEPLFPFGFGLSYTTFEYSGLSIAPDGAPGTLPVTVTCTVTNTGDRAGDEVAQLYVHDEIASRDRPVLQLRGIRRVHLDSGESRQVTFRLTAEELQMLDDAGQWIVEPGTFRIAVAASSKDLRLQERLSIR